MIIGEKVCMNDKFVDELRKLPNEINDLPNITKKIISDLNSKEFPIPIVKIMRELDFYVGMQELDDNLSGYIVIDKNLEKKFHKDKLVCVNSKDTLGHQRFTIAHELAHYIFDFNPESSEVFYSAYMTDHADEIDEKRANKFAANLLMPKEEFENMYNKFCKENESDLIEKLLNYFEVSKRAVELRIIELGLN